MSCGFEVITREKLDPNRQDDILLYQPGEQGGQPCRIISPEEEILMVRNETRFRADTMHAGINSKGEIVLRFFGDTEEKIIALSRVASAVLRNFVFDHLSEG